MNRRALILAWPHQSDTVISLAASLAEGLRANGIDVTVINVVDTEDYLKLTGFARNAFSQVYFLGSFPLQHKIDDRTLYEHFSAARCFFWVLDPLIYDLHRISATRAYIKAAQRSERLYVLFPDRSYMEFADAAIGKRSIYFPFAGSFVPPNATPVPPPPEQQPQARVLVVANIGHEMSELADRPLLEICGLLDPFKLTPARAASLSDHVMNNEHQSNVALAVRDFLGLDARDLWKPPILSFLVALDASEKRRRRRATVEAMTSVKLDIIGLGWKEMLGPRDNIRYIRTYVKHPALRETFARYQVLLDFAPNWDRGFNDRVMTSLGAGCRVVTTRNDAVGELGIASPLVSMYSTQHPEPQALVETALEQPPVPGSAVSSLRESHSWAAHVGQLLGRKTAGGTTMMAAE